MEQQTTIECPRCLVGRVIGKRGETIKALQKFSRTHIEINQNVEPCVVTIFGSTESTSLAMSVIIDIMNGTFKGFALLRKFTTAVRNNQPTLYAPGYGIIPTTPSIQTSDDQQAQHDADSTSGLGSPLSSSHDSWPAAVPPLDMDLRPLSPSSVANTNPALLMAAQHHLPAVSSVGLGLVTEPNMHVVCSQPEAAAAFISQLHAGHGSHLPAMSHPFLGAPCMAGPTIPSSYWAHQLASMEHFPHSLQAASISPAALASLDTEQLLAALSLKQAAAARMASLGSALHPSLPGPASGVQPSMQRLNELLCLRQLHAQQQVMNSMPMTCNGMLTQ